MALRYRVRDLRLYIGGDPVHGLTEDARTLLTLSPSAPRETYNRTAIGDPAGRVGYMRFHDTTLRAGGFFSSAYGLNPALDRAVAADLPVTWSQEGGGAASQSTIAESGAWRGIPIEASDNEPARISGECALSAPADALCIAEGRIGGGGTQATAGLSQVTRPVSIRTSSPRLQIVSGNREFQFQMRAADATRYVREDDYIQFVTGAAESQITGTYRVVNIQTSQGIPWSNVFAEQVPSTDQLANLFNLAARNSPDGIIIQDTFNGSRAALVHLSDLRRRDAVSVAVALQGQAPGSSNWQTIGAAQTAPISTANGADARFRQAFWFAVPDGQRNLNSVRAQIVFRTSANAPGVLPNYEAYVRADFAPRTVHR